MKILKKIIKIAVLLFLALVLGLTALDIYMIKKPEQDAKKNIEGIEELARKVEDLTINEKANVIGLGEATHGNAEFQGLKLDVLKVLVDKYDVSCYAMEMDYGGSLGESYSILNTICQDTVRIYCEPDYLYDSMIFVYECTPFNLLAK